MKFANIHMLFLIWIVPLLALVYLYGWRRRNKILTAFATQRALSHIVPPRMFNGRRLRAVLVLAAALTTVVAMAGPQYGFQWQEIERQGIDIIIALDCSRSMLARDIKPTRLDRAKREIYDLLTMLQGDRVGLVAFSGTAFLQCPLTIDYQAFYLFLDVLTPDYLPVGGSDLAAAVNTAVQAFDPRGKTDKAVILITDGENTGRGEPLQAAQDAQKAGVRLFCIGVGSEDGVPVPAAEGGFKKDGSGQIVLSRLDESLLTRMALATGGSYVRSVAGDMDLDTIYRDQIRARMEAATVESGRKQIWADRYQWPLALAVLMLFSALWVPVGSKVLMALLLPVILFTTYSPAQAGPAQKGFQAYGQGEYDKALEQFIDAQLQDPDNPEVLYNIGNGFYKTGDFEAAKEHYTQALTNAPPELKPKLLYNLGNTAYRLGDTQEAIQNYEAALNLDPRDIHAEENLAFVKKQLEQKQQNQEGQNQEGQQQNREEQQQQDQASGQKQKKDQQQGRNQDNEQGRPDSPQFGSEMGEQQQDRQASSEQSEAQQKQAQNGQARKRKDDTRSTGSPASAQMLNRLKDQPGRAMMPNYQKQQVDKDW